MRTLAAFLALALAASVASAAPRRRDEHAVTIASASDESPGVLDAHARRRHGEIVREALLDMLRRSGAEVRHVGMPPRQIDVAVIAWRITPRADRIDVTAELRVVVCDGRGKMLAIVTGRATVSALGKPVQIASLRAQALAEAVGGMTRSLQSQLARATS